MKKILYTIIAVTILFIPQNILAKASIKAGENITINKAIDGTAFYAASDVNVNKNINGVAFIAGNEVNINGDLDYAFIGANKIDLKSKVMSDLFLYGNEIKINKETMIMRDAYIGGSNVVVRGTFERDVRINGQSVLIENATLKGNLIMNADNVTIGENVIIEKNEFELNKDAALEMEDGTDLTVNYYEMIIKEPSLLEKSFAKVIELANLIVLSFIVLAIFKNFFKKVDELTKEKDGYTYFKYSLKGFLFLITIPIAAIIMLISTIGMSASFLLIGLYIAILTIAKIIIGFIVGRYILKDKTSDLFTGVLGTIIVFVSSQIPVLNIFVNIAILTIALGLSFEIIMNSIKEQN